MSPVLDVTAELNDAHGTFVGVVERFAAFSAIAERLGKLPEDTALPSPDLTFRLGKSEIPVDTAYGTEPEEIRAHFAEYCARFAVVGMITASEEFLQRVLLIAKLVRAAGGEAEITGAAFHALREETRKEVRRTSVDGLVPRILDTIQSPEELDGVDVFRTLYAARRCLLHRGGTVGADDLQSENALEVKWRRTVLMANGSEILTLPFEAIEGTEISVAFADVARQWSLGDQVRLSARDCQEIGLTLEMFSSKVVNAVARACSKIIGPKQATP